MNKNNIMNEIKRELALTNDLGPVHDVLYQGGKKTYSTHPFGSSWQKDWQNDKVFVLPNNNSQIWQVF